MRKLLLASAVLGVTLSPAIGADLPTSVPAAIPAPTAIVNWSGFYVGAHAGYGFAGDLTGDVSLLGELGTGINPKGWVGGLQLGYNVQVNQLVFGVEADIALSGIEDTASVTGAIALSPGVILAGTASAKADMQWISTIRGRIGFTFDRALIYVTGGLAIAEFEGRLSGVGTLTFNGTPFNLALGTSSTKTHVGWALGAGLEYALDRNWSLRADYLYVDLGKERYFAGTGADADIGFRGSQIRAAVNYRF